MGKKTLSTKSRANQSQPNVQAKNNADVIQSSDSFPFARYTSVVGVNSSLMIFVGLFLPRGTVLFDATNPSATTQTTSRDRPQHPFLEAITANPVSSLAYICLGVVVLQAWWSAWLRAWYIDSTLKGTLDERKMQRQSLDKRKFAQLRNAWLFALASSIIFHTIVVVLGAPLLSHVPHTYLLSLILAILTVVPPAYIFGIPSLNSDTESLLVRFTWIRMFPEFRINNPIERAIVYPAFGAILGSWLGAIPIALDWDRPWQAWPLTPVYGALAGYILASLAALTVSAIKALAEEHLRTLRDSKQD
ncbi:GPI biosynthesis protein family Pig-F-domain-containing protein [Lentinula raphanica]|uniref:GPI biosynthesis protein family Pig-F-domain-containing protein n=1 Tax=Lentinula raphanica TaxID=153919 RepID=A0AA38U3X9_9AGAR|nr:GPI biosynthesis protein family Pig-F-domain-containing protein [Lentinula raphanica]KAJ3976274.1 GPI biosynthesis protein family Pig-F-domain-containing protein [Lentinula raphanica]